jgi:putative flippase GtrA
MLLIVLGIGFDRVRFSERLKLFLALGLFAGAVTFPLGVLLQTFSHGPLPRAVAIAGSTLVIVALAGIALGVTRASTAME